MLSLSRKPSGCFSFMVSVVDIIQRFLLRFLSLVYLFLFGFRRRRKHFLMLSFVFLFMVSVVAGKQFLWFPWLVFGGFCRRRRIHNLRMYLAIPRFVFLGLVSIAVFCLWFPSWQENIYFMVSVVGFLFLYGFRLGKERSFMVSVVGFLFYGFRLLQERGCLSDGNRNKNHQDVSATN